jgi:Malectin domain/Glycosyl hydrolases family 18/Putative Ig domain
VRLNVFSTKGCLILITMFLGSLHAQQWMVGVYYANSLPLSAIPWSKFTIVQYANAAPGVGGTVAPGYVNSAEVQQLIAARPAGKKLTLQITDGMSTPGATDFSSAINANGVQFFANSIASYVNQNGFDGVQIDWESNLNSTQHISLFSALRAAMPTKLIGMDTAAYGGLPNVAAASQSNLDIIDIDCYDMDWASFAWFNTAVFSAGNSNVMSCADGDVSYFLQAGVAPSKLGIGIPFYGRILHGVTQPLQTGNFTKTTVLYKNLVSDATRWQAQYQQYDNTHKGQYLSIPALNEFVSYTGPQQIQDIVSWAKSQGFGGVMAFALDSDYIAGQTGDAQHPLVTAVYNAWGGSASATAPTITTFSLGTATVGTGYSQTLTASGSIPLTWTVVSGALPAGLSLGSSSGTINGTPTTAGTSSFTVQVSNSAGSNSKSFSISVALSLLPPVITSTSLPSGTVGTGYSGTLTASGGTPIIWSVTGGTLPAGLSLNSFSGVISGTPLAAGTSTFILQASNSAGSNSKAFSLAINPFSVLSNTFTPILVNSGGPSYTDPQGQVWSADTGAIGGFTYSTTNSVSNTNTPSLYQTERFGAFQYQFPVPNGTYTTTLKFAEIFFTSRGQRVFNVSINGQTVLSNFDIFAQAGRANKAIDKSFTVTVSGGQIQIQFSNVVNNAKIDAIQIVAVSPGGGTGGGFTPIRVNGGGPAYTDSLGNSWSADTSWSGGIAWTNSIPIANTSDPTLYQSERLGNFQYQFPVPNGTYTVTLKFAEIYWTAPGQRVFNVIINGQTVLSNFDIVAQAGTGKTAVDRAFSVFVTGGQITIQFTTVVDNAKISAIQIN